MSVHSRFNSSIVITVAALLTSSCVLVSNDRSGDVIFEWTFAQRQCFEVPEVAQVTVQIPGQTLQNSGVYNCINGNTGGIRLLQFRPGTYPFTILGQNAAGTVLYQSSGSFTVNGDVAVSVDLQPVASATGSVYVSWSLPSPTPVPCQYIAAVDVSFDNGPIQSFFCEEGGTSPGILFQDLLIGRHSIDISARDVDGHYYYRTIQNVDVYAGGASAQQFTLEWLVGSLPLKWSFSNGVRQLSCSEAGVNEVLITLRDGQNPDEVLTVACLSQGIQGYTIPYPYYGTYQVFLTAYAGPMTYQSNVVSYTVLPGSFPDLNTPGVDVLLMTP